MIVELIVAPRTVYFATVIVFVAHSTLLHAAPGETPSVDRV